MSVTRHFSEDAQYEKWERVDDDADVEHRGKAILAAYDHDGSRYCCACAADHDKIDREQYHTDPWSVPAGGSVPLGSMVETDHTYVCDHCGATIPEP